MSHTAVCTIRSKEKRKDEGLLPARKRYIGSHISKVEKIAKEGSLRFFILSGCYGFISGDKGIPYYDYLLLEDKVENLALKVRSQLQEHGVEELNFYTKTKQNWLPYRNALSRA